MVLLNSIFRRLVARRLLNATVISIYPFFFEPFNHLLSAPVVVVGC